MTRFLSGAFLLTGALIALSVGQHWDRNYFDLFQGARCWACSSPLQDRMPASPLFQFLNQFTVRISLSTVIVFGSALTLPDLARVWHERILHLPAMAERRYWIAHIGTFSLSAHGFSSIWQDNLTASYIYTSGCMIAFAIGMFTLRPMKSLPSFIALCGGIVVGVIWLNWTFLMMYTALHFAHPDY